MYRIMLGGILLVLGVCLTGFGLWRGSVWLFGGPGPHWPPQPNDQKREALAAAVEEKQHRVTAARQVGDAKKVEAAETSLKAAQAVLLMAQTDVTMASRLEATMSLASLFVGVWLAVVGWRRSRGHDMGTSGIIVPNNGGEVAGPP